MNNLVCGAWTAYDSDLSFARPSPIKAPEPSAIIEFMIVDHAMGVLCHCRSKSRDVLKEIIKDADPRNGAQANKRFPC